jgi:hypothetical protein
MQVTRHHSRRVSPFGHPRIHARLTAPRGITQPPTSFIGSQCQGIHHAPLNTYNTKNQKKKLPHKETLFELKNSEIAHQHTKSARPHQGNRHHLRVRCSQPLSTNQTPHPTTKAGRQPSPIPRFPHSGRRDSGLVVSKPNSVSDDFAAPVFSPPTAKRLLLHPNRTHYRHGPSHESPRSPNPHKMWAGQWVSWCSLERR